MTTYLSRVSSSFCSYFQPSSFRKSEYPNTYLVLRVSSAFASCVCRKYAAIFHSLISDSSGSQRNFFYASKSLNVARLSLVNYSLFSKKIVNFSTNQPLTYVGPWSDYFDDPGSEIQFAKAYGSERLDRYLSCFSDAITSLSSKDYPNLSNSLGDGVCVGMSTDFIMRYFNHISSGKSKEEAIDEASGAFTEGATKDSEIIQLVSSDYYKKNRKDIDEIDEDLDRNLKSGISKLKNEFENLDKAFTDRIKKLKNSYLEKSENSDSENSQSKLNEFNEAISEIQEEFELKVKELKKSYKSDFLKSWKKVLVSIGDTYLEIKSKLLQGFNVELSLKDPFQIFEEDLLDKKFDCFSKLGPGVYTISYVCVNCFPETDSPAEVHEMVLVKDSDTKGYLFDPNYGCISFDKDQDCRTLLAYSFSLVGKGDILSTSLIKYELRSEKKRSCE